MYSKLGGCLGVTTKLGPLARTDLWAGVKGLLERLMTHLGLGSSFEEPWVGLPGGVEEGMLSWEVVLATWEDCVGLCQGGTYYLAYLPWGVIALPCMGGVRGLRGAISLPMWKERSSLGGIVFFPWGKENNTLGRAVIFWGKMYSSGERIASFSRRKVSNCQSRETTWCLGIRGTVTFRGKVYSCWERIASFPGRKVSNCRSRKYALCLTIGRTVTFQGRVTSCRERIASFPWRKVSNSWGRMTACYLTVRLG